MFFDRFFTLESLGEVCQKIINSSSALKGIRELHIPRIKNLKSQKVLAPNMAP